MKDGLEKYESRLKMFQDSQFSFLLDIPSFRYNGAIIHSLLSRHRSDMGELVFELRENFLNFTKMDFALITGLKFGDIYTVEKSTSKKSIKDTYFKKYPIVKNSLLQAFEKIVDSNKHSDVVKIALLMCVEFFVRGTDTKNHCNPLFIELVNSLEEFNKYPWGNVAFESMSQGIQNASHSAKSGGKTYNVLGCIFLLQVSIICLFHKSSIYFQTRVFESNEICCHCHRYGPLKGFQP